MDLSTPLILLAIAVGVARALVGRRRQRTLRSGALTGSLASTDARYPRYPGRRR